MTGLRVGSATDAGRVRDTNEDSALVADGIFAVADGMGGHAAGEVASQVAVEALEDYAGPGVEGEEDMVHAVQVANRAVMARAQGTPELAGMGTTMVALALVPTDALDGDAPDDASTSTTFLLANVGDSRAYLFRDGDLTQLTRDHSLVEDLVQEGRLTPAEARTHPQRNIVTRVLGNDPDVEPDVFTADPRRGDRYVLCSDGLFDELEDERIAAVLRRLGDPDEAARELVRLANESGGRDNITVVLVDVTDDDDRGRKASKALGGAGRRNRRRGGDGTTTATATAGSATAVLDRVEADGPEGRAPPSVTTRAERRSAKRAARRARPRRLTFRSLVFVLVVLLVAAAAVGAVWWFGRNTFYVGVDGDRVAIFRGRPGGVLWIEPTVEQRTSFPLSAVPEERRPDLERGRTEPTLDDARDYVRSLRARRTQLDEQARRRDEANRATTSTTEP